MFDLNPGNKLLRYNRNSFRSSGYKTSGRTKGNSRFHKPMYSVRESAQRKLGVTWIRLPWGFNPWKHPNLYISAGKFTENLSP